MADPATQFQPAGLNTNTYTPVKGGDLGGSHLFGGAGQIWAGIGQTALNAAAQFGQTAQMLQQSPENPAVRSQMYEAQSRADMGRDYIDFVRKNPSYFQGTVGEGPGGATAVAPITQSVQQQSGWNIGPGGDGGKTPKEEKKSPPQEEKKSPQPPKDLNSGMTQAQPDLSAALASTSVPSHGGSTAAMGAGDPTQLNTGQPQSSDVVAQPAQQQGGSIYSPMRPSPMAPPAPGAAPAPAQPPPAQGQSPAAATQADQAAMAQWRTQNEHPVMSSQDALGWMKNFDTGVKRATYLPMGGPGGSPAFAFHMDGGGINTVPVSQMAQKGGGPLIAGQNTSQVISSTDQAQQQQTAQNQPNISPPPPANLPPPAPTGPQVAQAGPVYNPMQPAPGQPAPGQPAPGQPAPAAPGAYDPTPYRQAVAQAIANPQNLMAQENPQAGVRSTEGTGADVHPVPTSTADIDAMNAESKSPTMLPGWKVDAAGNKYKELPDPQHPFWQQRFYPMTGGFQTGTWGNAENARKQALLEEFGGAGGVPPGKDAKGNPIVLDQNAIDKLSPDEQNQWLNYARDYKLHKDAPSPTSADGVNLANNANAVAAAQRIYDKLQYLKQEGIEPKDAISQAELIRSKEAGWAAAAGGNDPIQWGLWSLLAHGPKNSFADSLGSDYKLLNSYLAQVKGGHYPEAATPPDKELGGKITWPVDIGDRSIPTTTDVSTIPALNKIGSGDTINEAIDHIKEVLGNAKTDYKNAAIDLKTSGSRVPDEHQRNLYDLDSKKGFMDDATNRITRDAQGKLVNNYGEIPSNKWLDNWAKGQAGQSPSPSASPTPSPTPPQIPNWDTKYLDQMKIDKGDAFTGPDGKVYHRTTKLNKAQ